MKELECKVWEISRKEIPKLPDKTQVLCYNTLFKDFQLMRADNLVKILPKLSKFHVYFTLNEPNFNSSAEARKNQEKKRTRK